MILFVLAATAAQAAPVQRTVAASLELALPLDPGSFAVTGTGTVTVDTATGKIVIPEGLVSLTAKVVVPITSLSAGFFTGSSLFNRAATFSLGGAGYQLPGEVCPSGGRACVAGGGLGGRMQLDGNFVFLANPHVGLRIPILQLYGNGGSSNVPFTWDGAAWTRGTGVITTPNGSSVVRGSGSIGGSQVTFVTPTFVSLLGTPISLFTTVTLDFVPEPGTLCLLAAGVAGLAVVAGRRRR